MLAALIVLAAACGDDDDRTTAPEAATDAPNAGDADGSAVDRNATLRFGYGINVSRLDPHRATIRNDMTTLAPVYDRLIEMDPAGELVPMLATEWSFDPTATVLDLRLRQGVQFHDGSPFNAEAVRANVERGQTLEGSTVSTDLESIVDVEVVDEHHIRLHLAEPNVALVGLLSDRAGMMVSPAAFDEDLDAVAVGAGPFRLVESRPDDVTIYERFEDYWDPDAALVQRLELRVMADPTTRLNGLRTGQLDATTLNPSQHAEAEGLDGITIQTDPTLFFVHFSFNRARSHLGDLDARRAIMHGLDPDAICQGVLFGLCDTSVQPFPDGYWAANPDIGSDRYAHDPDKSRELLAEAGLSDGFTFTLMIPANLPPYPEMAEAIQAQLAEVGIDVELLAMEPAQMADRMYARKETDAIIGGLTGSADPALYFGQRIIASAYANPGDHSTPEIEELYLRSIATVDPDERRQVLHDAVEEVVDQVLGINLLFPHTVGAFRDEVVGYVNPMSGNPDFRGMGITAG